MDELLRTIGFVLLVVPSCLAWGLGGAIAIRWAAENWPWTT
jgi:hypothetical protein